jgi:hypothetical protein
MKMGLWRGTSPSGAPSLNVFVRPKSFHRIATRYVKLGAKPLGVIHLALIAIRPKQGNTTQLTQT